MRILDEIAHRHNPLANRVTDFYFVDGDTRLKVTETGEPTHIVGGEVDVLRWDYVVFVFRPTGWVEIAKLGQEHAETSQHAASIALRLITDTEA